MEKIKQKLKHLYILGRYPEQDWIRLLSLFCILGAFIAGWSVFFYFKVSSSVFSESTIGAAGNALSQKKEKELQGIIDRYEGKAARYNGLLKNLPAVVIPAATTTAATTSASAGSADGDVR